MIKSYYSLTKPGIIRGNLVTATAGFCLAARGHIGWWLLLQTLLGISLIIASACVCNNYIDRGIDAKMKRTKDRALVSGAVSGRQALFSATVLGLLGLLVLVAYTNWLTVGLGLVAFFIYVVLYGLGKRRSVHGTLIGSVPGALPPVAGYTAVTGHLDGGALLLFLILVCWQMPHFYGIALYRLKDYAAAGLPVLPVARGPRPAKIQILLYILAFMVAAALLSVYGYTGWAYLAVSLLLGIGWLALGLRNFKTMADERWGRSMFLCSLAVIMVWSITIVASAWLP